MTQSVLGIVGGSGLYDIPALKNMRWEDVSSPWGAPSDQILFAEIDGLPIRFLPRHGRGHKVPPSAINFRANIDALKRAGVTDLVSVSACGSLQGGAAARAISCSSTSSSTAPSRARRASSAPAASPTSRWPIR